MVYEAGTYGLSDTGEKDNDVFYPLTYRNVNGHVVYIRFYGRKIHFDPMK